VRSVVVVKTKIGEYLVKEALLYTDTDEWVQVVGDLIVVGITDYAQKKLRHVVNVELPEAGREVRRGEVIATLESVKAIADIYTPVDGTIVEVNDKLTTSPDLINKDPYGNGWVAKIKVSGTLPKLLTPDEYVKYIEKREGVS
jgi:glycine cleavage system H protein